MPKKQSAPDDPVRIYLQTMRTFMRLSTEWTSAAAQTLGVHPTDLVAGSYLAEKGPVTAGELGREMGITTGAMTAAIDRLERAGFATRAPDPADRRKVIIKPKKLPAALLAMRRSIANQIDAILARYSKTELSRMTAITRDIILVFEKQINQLKK